MAEYTALAPLFTDIANAIRSKTGETGTITANNFPREINNIQIGIDTSDATASAANIQSGYTAYAKGSKISRTLSKGATTLASTNTSNETNIVSSYIESSVFKNNILTLRCRVMYRDLYAGNKTGYFTATCNFS